jgi:hypothetical protein
MRWPSHKGLRLSNMLLVKVPYEGLAQCGVVGKVELKIIFTGDNFRGFPYALSSCCEAIDRDAGV